MKKILLNIKTIGLVFLMLMLSAAALSSCHEDKNVDTAVYAWEKTFGFTGEMDDFNEIYTEKDGVQGTARETLLKQEFEKGNLDLSGATVNGIPLDLSYAEGFSADGLVAEIRNIVLEKFNTAFSDITIAFGTEASLSVVINGTEYHLLVSSPTVYTIYLTSYSHTVGSLSPILTDTVHGIAFGKNCLSATLSNTIWNSDLPREEIVSSNLTVYVPTKTVIDDISALVQKENNVITETRVFLSYTAYFSEKSE